MIDLLVKNEAKNICKDKIWSFFNVLALASVISCRFKKHQNKFNQKIYVGKNLAVTIVYSCYDGHN